MRIGTDTADLLELRNISCVSLNGCVVQIHIKHQDKPATKTYDNEETAKTEFEKLSRIVENYIIVKSGKPRNL